MSTRIFVADPLTEGASLALPDEAARHVGQVLRMRVGEPLVLFNGHGGEWPAAIETVERRSLTVRIGTHQPVDRESPLNITLAQCVSKGERMDYTIQKAVELGVSAIIPLVSSRSVVKLDEDRWEKKLDHWRGIILSACEQSGRTRVPTLAPVAKLERWLGESQTTPALGTKLVLAPGGTRSLKALPSAASSTLLVGPEGGLSDAEITLAVRCGFEAIGLGPRILRTETAGVAALAALQVLWGDVG